jgi:hypothetical protein
MSTHGFLQRQNNSQCDRYIERLLATHAGSDNRPIGISSRKCLPRPVIPDPCVEWQRVGLYTKMDSLCPTEWQSCYRPMQYLSTFLYLLGGGGLIAVIPLFGELLLILRVLAYAVVLVEQIDHSLRLRFNDRLGHAMT